MENRQPRALVVDDERHTIGEMWSYDYLGDFNVAEAYVSYLRRKLNGSVEPDPIQTVRAGYRLGG
jgi:DNA-binding response OmpR family regulator